MIVLKIKLWIIRLVDAATNDFAASALCIGGFGDIDLDGRVGL